MNLFISNFKKEIKIFAYFVVLFIIYNCFLLFKKPIIIEFQNDWKKNYSYAQDFIYESKATNVIVGSSMSARMRKSFFPNDFYNLSFAGSSALTGLEIVRKSNMKVERIFVETNTVFKEKNVTLINALYYPILWEIKKYIPALQEKNQPLNLIISMIKGRYGRTHEQYMKVTRNADIFNANIKLHEEKYSKNLTKYENELEDLKNHLNYFENLGVKIIFFELPIDNKLKQSLKAKQQRKIITDNFNYSWINIDQDNKYITTDGIHLLYKSAFEYCNEFLKNIEKMEK